MVYPVDASSREQNGDAVKEVTKTSESSPTWERIVIFVSGIIFLTLLLLLAVQFPEPTKFQYIVFRVTLALAASGFAALVPGFMQIKYKDAVRTGGALGVFFVVYFFSPADWVVGSDPRHKPDAPNSDVVLPANPANPLPRPTPNQDDGKNAAEPTDRPSEMPVRPALPSLDPVPPRHVIPATASDSRLALIQQIFDATRKGRLSIAVAKNGLGGPEDRAANTLSERLSETFNVNDESEAILVINIDNIDTKLTKTKISIGGFSMWQAETTIKISTTWTDRQRHPLTVYVKGTTQPVTYDSAPKYSLNEALENTVALFESAAK